MKTIIKLWLIISRTEKNVVTKKDIFGKIISSSSICCAVVNDDDDYDSNNSHTDNDN